MTADQAVDLGRQALLTAIMLAAPLVGIALVVGLLVALFQAVTQIQDQTISAVPKIIATLLALAFCLPWLVQRLTEYSQELFASVPKVIGGG